MTGAAARTRTRQAQLIVIAKAPVPGRVKTRLTPPFTPLQAAELATAALTDTLDAVLATPVRRRVLALAGRPGGWLPAGFDVLPQRGGGLAERLAAAFADAYAALAAPMVLIGMDTPQVSAELLTSAVDRLAGADAVLGPAADGGFWLLGLRGPDERLLRGVPMSKPYTGQRQLARLHEHRLRVESLPMLTDVDTARQAAEVARFQRGAGGGRFCRLLGAIEAA